MKKVLIFINSLTDGGAERFATMLAGYLAENGYGVSVVTMHRTDRDFFVLDPRVERVGLDLAGGNAGIHKIAATLGRIRALRSEIKRRRADVVIGLMSAPAVLAILACIGLKSRVIASERNFPGRKEVPMPWRGMRNVFYRLADAHVAQTHKSADWIRSRTSARNVHVVPNSVVWPIPACPPTIPPDSVVSAGQRVVLAVGSKIDQKGFDLLVSAFCSATVNRGEWRLVILGPDASGRMTSEASRLHDQAAVLGIDARMHLPGRAGNMTDWYRRADIFVLSSRYEGFPNVLLEAMAGGCPCIAFDCDTGPSEIIENEVNGLLVRPEDTDALTDALTRLVQAPELRERLGESAISVRCRFSEERSLGSWKRIIDDLDC